MTFINHLPSFLPSFLHHIYSSSYFIIFLHKHLISHHLIGPKNRQRCSNNYITFVDFPVQLKDMNQSLSLPIIYSSLDHLPSSSSFIIFLHILHSSPSFIFIHKHPLNHHSIGPENRQRCSNNYITFVDFPVESIIINHILFLINFLHDLLS
jgi:hypothetical protein